MFLTECSTPEREEEIYKILIFCIDCDIKANKNIKDVNSLDRRNQ